MSPTRRTLLASDATSTLYVAALLAGRLDAANVALVELKRQLEVAKPNVAVVETVDKITQLLSDVGTATANASSSGQSPDPPSNLSRGGARFLPDAATIERSLAMLPVSTYELVEIAIKAGETSAKLLFLRKKGGGRQGGRQIARISEPRAILASWPSYWISPFGGRARTRTFGIQCRRRTDFARKRFDDHALRRGQPRWSA